MGSEEGVRGDGCVPTPVHVLMHFPALLLHDFLSRCFVVLHCWQKYGFLVDQECNPLLYFDGPFWLHLKIWEPATRSLSIAHGLAWRLHPFPNRLSIQAPSAKTDTSALKMLCNFADAHVGVQ